ncbi:radical SAM/SPASM domain-containing protein [Empedobacter brevis NBRC 14943 = ATCC 43319]|uniref:Radical SAM/SPASM domain-containing protein n=2 Tax=Empedobacter brevis TaxID=247 RepID=A0A511NJ00_9FLAO|nr:radical SAM/SPASM domain-containing protein [Empedobacter brevis NBRC 14943 = ATCC 43319]
MKFSNYHLSTDNLSEVGLENKRIIFSTRTATSIMIDERIYEKLIVNQFSEVEPELLRTLEEKEFIIPNEQNEFDFVTSLNKEMRAKSNFLSMTIQPSANCQLGCHYCGQNHTKDYATDEVINKYEERIQFLLNQKEGLYEGLAVTWYGGEPLTGYSSIKKTSQRLIELCESKNMGYISDMITNGLSLKPKLFKDLVEVCRVTNYQITLDGTAESHDQRRFTKTGEPTFDIIMNNIVEVVKTDTYDKHNCRISIRVNIDKTNYQFVDGLIEQIKDCGISHKVSVYFAPIVDFGGNDAGKDGLDKNFFAQLEIDWLFKCYEYNISVEILPTRKFSVCMVDMEDSEVWDAFGNIYACWEFPYSDTYKAGDSLIGNLFKPAETYNKNATLRDWDNTLESGSTWCKTCNHLPVCGGGCPKSWFEGTPACPSFKFNYKDKLLLDYYIKKRRKDFEKENKVSLST